MSMYLFVNALCLSKSSVDLGFCESYYLPLLKNIKYHISVCVKYQVLVANA